MTVNTLMESTPKSRLRRLIVAVSLSVLGVGLAGCSNDTAGPETGTDIEDIQERDIEEGDGVTDATVPFHGPYDETFKDNVDDWTEQDVTVSARLNEILTDGALTIAGTEDTTVDALLVLHENLMSFAPGDVLEVTGTVHGEFVLAEVEEQLSADLDDELFAPWEGEPYIDARSIEELK